jgi:hypothetical protein
MITANGGAVPASSTPTSGATDPPTTYPATPPRREVATEERCLDCPNRLRLSRTLVTVFPGV